MTEFVNNFHFLRPWILLLLLIPLFFYFTIFKNYHNLSSWSKVCDKQLLDFLLIKGNDSRRKVSAFLMYIGLAFAIIASAGPSWQKEDMPALNYNTPLMIALNLSSEMKQTDVKPDRLSRAEMAVKDLLKLPQNADTGLIVYSGEPFLISPLSADAELVVNLLPAIDFDIMPLNGDRLDRTINLAVEKIKAAEYTQGDIVIFSAGAGINHNQALAAAEKAASEGVYVNAVNIAKTNSPQLEQIVKAGGGVYADVTDFNPQEFLNKITAKHQQQWQETANKIGQWQDYGYYLLIVPFICCLYFFRRGLWAVVLLCLLSHSAWAGFWFADNYEAMQNFKQNNYERAAQGFKDDNWRGAAFYKAGEYKKAAELYARKNDVESVYNLGNALAKSGQTDEAIKKYEQVLRQNPNHKDAEFNLEYLKQQQQNQQQNTQNEQQEQNKQQQQNSAEQNQENQEQKQDGQQNKSSDSDNEQNANDEWQTPSSNEKLNDEQQKNDEQSASSQEQNNNTKTEQSAEQRQVPAAPVKEGDKNDKYDEQIQAREQRMRDIPEDKGGLLRAFIYKEYNKNRYGD